jgi:hypothetical protein
VLLLNECLLFISLLTQYGNFWIRPLHFSHSLSSNGGQMLYVYPWQESRSSLTSYQFPHVNIIIKQWNTCILFLFLMLIFVRVNSVLEKNTWRKASVAIFRLGEGYGSMSLLLVLRNIYQDMTFSWQWRNKWTNRYTFMWTHNNSSKLYLSLPRHLIPWSFSTEVTTLGSLQLLFPPHSALF